jgi:hypothetical protein
MGNRYQKTASEMQSTTMAVIAMGWAEFICPLIAVELSRLHQ